MLLSSSLRSGRAAYSPNVNIRRDINLDIKIDSGINKHASN